jgi:hypothetical protein
MRPRLRLRQGLLLRLQKVADTLTTFQEIEAAGGSRHSQALLSRSRAGASTFLTAPEIWIKLQLSRCSGFSPGLHWDDQPSSRPAEMEGTRQVPNPSKQPLEEISLPLRPEQQVPSPGPMPMTAKQLLRLPCQCPPGSDEKIAVMQARAGLRLPIFVEGDAALSDRQGYLPAAKSNVAGDAVSAGAVVEEGAAGQHTIVSRKQNAPSAAKMLSNESLRRRQRTAAA